MRPSEVFYLRCASDEYSCDILELAQKDVCMCVALRLKDEYMVVIPEETVYILDFDPLWDLDVLDPADKMPTAARYRVQQSNENHRYHENIAANVIYIFSSKSRFLFGRGR